MRIVGTLSGVEAAGGIVYTIILSEIERGESGGMADAPDLGSGGQP